MAEQGGARAGTGEQTAQIKQLQGRIEELEGELRSREAGAAARSPAVSGWGKVLTATLAATTVLMAAPAFITVRRWIRWWL